MNTVKEILGEELYARVRDKLGNDKGLIIDDGMLIPKHRFDCINVSLREHKSLVLKLREENSRLAIGFSEFERLKLENERLKRELRISVLILAEKPKNFNAVRSNIAVGELTGKKLDAFVKKRVCELKKTDSYLFQGERLYRLTPVDEPAETEKRDELSAKNK